MPFAESNDLKIHYREDGGGTPVVAIHGSASTSYQWESLTGFLSGHFRVIRPDLPGYGKSAGLGEGATITDFALSLATVFDVIGEPFHLVGHSFGGAIALRVASLMPDRILSLCVFEPAAFHLLANSKEGQDRERHVEIDPVIEAMRAAHANGNDADAMACFIDFWNGAGAWSRTGEDLRRKMTGLASRVIGDFDTIAAERATFADYARIALPTLAITGRKSPKITQHIAEGVAKSLPAARFTDISGVGHMAPLTNPGIVNPVIADHIVRTDGRRNRVGEQESVAA